MIISKDKLKKEAACRLLEEASRRLERLPLKTDFTEDELVFIKAHLGPWPRALEAAGLKPKRSPAHNPNRLKKKRNI